MKSLLIFSCDFQHSRHRTFVINLFAWKFCLWCHLLSLLRLRLWFLLWWPCFHVYVGRCRGSCRYRFSRFCWAIHMTGGSNICVLAWGHMHLAHKKSAKRAQPWTKGKQQLKIRVYSCQSWHLKGHYTPQCLRFIQIIEVKHSAIAWGLSRKRCYNL